MEERIQQLLQAATDFLNSNTANGTWIKTLLYSPLFTTFAGAAIAPFASCLAANLQGRQKNVIFMKNMINFNNAKKPGSIEEYKSDIK